MTWTLLGVKSKVRKDLDIDEDELVSDSDMVEFIHDAVRDMAAEMIKLGADDRYYMTNGKMSLVQGQEEYALPSDISTQKIYKLIHTRSNSRDNYAIRRLRGIHEFENYHWENEYPTSNPTYRYLLMNRNPVDGAKLMLVPIPQVSESLAVTIWYVRKPTKATTDVSIIDVPEEFISFVLTFAKVECLKKDVGNPLLGEAKDELGRIRKLMVDTLTDQTADADNLIEQDLSLYMEMV
jgi:hypothetical protein